MRMPLENGVSPAADRIDEQRASTTTRLIGIVMGLIFIAHEDARSLHHTCRDMRVEIETYGNRRLRANADPDLR